jgi:hypothetical protein
MLQQTIIIESSLQHEKDLMSERTNIIERSWHRDLKEETTKLQEVYDMTEFICRGSVREQARQVDDFTEQS